MAGRRVLAYCCVTIHAKLYRIASIVHQAPPVVFTNVSERLALRDGIHIKCHGCYGNRKDRSPACLPCCHPLHWLCNAPVCKLFALLNATDRQAWAAVVAMAGLEWSLTGPGDEFLPVHSWPAFDNYALTFGELIATAVDPEAQFW